MTLHTKLRFTLAALGIAAVALPVFAAPPAPVGAPAKEAPAAASAAAPTAGAKSDPTAGGFADLRPGKVDKGNAKLPEVKKTRGAEAFVPSSKEVIVGWFKEHNIMHRVDEQGRMILPFRDDASGLNLNLVLIPRMKGNGNLWAVQAVVPVSVPIPAGDAGLLKAIAFANQWNNENFFVKVSAVAPQGSQPFFLLDAAMPCEAGIAKQEFFTNFVGIVVQTAQSFVTKAAGAMNQ